MTAVKIWPRKEEIMKYTIKVLEDTVMCDIHMEESYGMIQVLDDKEVVGLFQMCNTEIFDEEDFIKELKMLDAKELMSRPRLYTTPKQIIDIHNDIMASSNLCIYSSDMVEWFNTQEAYGQTWDEYIEWLETYVMEHQELNGLLDFTDGDNDYIAFGDFMSAFNLVEKKEIDWEAVALNLLSLAETLDYVGDYKNGLRERLQKEVGLTEEQLKEIGI